MAGFQQEYWIEDSNDYAATRLRGRKNRSKGVTETALLGVHSFAATAANKA